MLKQAQAILTNLITCNGNDSLGHCLEMTLSADAGLRYPFLQAMTVVLRQSTLTDLALRRRKSDSSLRPFTKVSYSASEGCASPVADMHAIVDAHTKRRTWIA